METNFFLFDLLIQYLYNDSCISLHITHNFKPRKNKYKKDKKKQRLQTQHFYNFTMEYGQIQTEMKRLAEHSIFIVFNSDKINSIYYS